MNLTFHVFWILCGFGAAVFATTATNGWQGRLGLALGFAAAAIGARPGHLPDPAWAGGLTALAVVFHIFRPGRRVLAAACGGVLAGLWCSLLQMQGVPLAPALALAIALPVASALLAARRPAFAPPELQEEALLIVLGLALVVAVFPSVREGWRSAVALNLAMERNSAVAPAWGLLLGASAAVLGGFFSFWRRR